MLRNCCEDHRNPRGHATYRPKSKDKGPWSPKRCCDIWCTDREKRDGNGHLTHSNLNAAQQILGSKLYTTASITPSELLEVVCDTYAVAKCVADSLARGYAFERIDLATRVLQRVMQPSDIEECNGLGDGACAVMRKWRECQAAHTAQGDAPPPSVHILSFYTSSLIHWDTESAQSRSTRFAVACKYFSHSLSTLYGPLNPLKLASTRKDQMQRLQTAPPKTAASREEIELLQEVRNLLEGDTSCQTQTAGNKPTAATSEQQELLDELEVERLRFKLLKVRQARQQAEEEAAAAGQAEQRKAQAEQHITTGDMHWARSELSSALKAYNEANRLQPNHAHTLSHRGAVKFKLEDYDGALADLNAADELAPDDAFTLSYRGATRLLLNDYKGALVDLNAATRLQPNDAFTLACRGATRYMLSEYKDSLTDLNASDKMKPIDAYMLARRGAAKYMLADYQGSLADLNAAVHLKPDDAFTLKNLGLTLAQLGCNKRLKWEYADALRDLDAADRLQPNDAFTLQQRGATKHMLKDYQGALRDLHAADWLQPNDAFTLQQRGVTKRLMGDYQGALLDLSTADQLKPNDHITLEERGQSSVCSGTTKVQRLICVAVPKSGVL